jgi:arginine/lysine/ornithine decarboxylase
VKLDQRQAPYFDAWLAYRAASIQAYSTPGHKLGRGMPDEMARAIGPQFLQLDIPHGGGVDDTHLSHGYLEQAEALAADAWGAEHATFLVNGSTTGNQAFLLATCRPGDEVILARNLHKSLLAGLIFSGAKPVYLYPAVDPEHNLSLDVGLDDVRRALDDHPAAKAVILVSPAYSGVSSDLPAIAGLCKERGVPLLVDEAWGPHFPFHHGLPPSAMQAGAAGAVTSIHKLLPGLTQSSLLMLQGDLVDTGAFRSVASMLQTTSPAAYIHASIDACRRQMALSGQGLLTRTLALAVRAREQIGLIDGVTVIGPEVIANRPGAAFDPTRLLVDVHGLGLTGYQAEEILREQYRVGVEMSDLVSVIVMLSVADDEKTTDHLIAGFNGLSTHARLTDVISSASLRSSGSVILVAQQVLTPREAMTGKIETVALANAAGRVSAEIITPYPPGIPVIAPGEVITADLVDYLRFGQAAGMYISGPADPRLVSVRVVAG